MTAVVVVTFSAVWSLPGTPCCRRLERVQSGRFASDKKEYSLSLEHFALFRKARTRLSAVFKIIKKSDFW